MILRSEKQTQTLLCYLSIYAIKSTRLQLLYQLQGLRGSKYAFG